MAELRSQTAISWNLRHRSDILLRTISLSAQFLSFTLHQKLLGSAVYPRRIQTLDELDETARYGPEPDVYSMITVVAAFHCDRFLSVSSSLTP